MNTPAFAFREHNNGSETRYKACRNAELRITVSRVWSCLLTFVVNFCYAAASKQSSRLSSRIHFSSTPLRALP